MYKISLFVLLIAAVCTALPAGNEETQYEAAPRGVRLARDTCQLLYGSARGVIWNHTACAAHCLNSGNGYSRGVCTPGGDCNCW